MVLKPDQERVRTLLKDTITLLCRNGLSFNAKFCIDAVIGVTLDDRELFYMSMNEVIKSEKSLLRGEPPESSEEDDEMSEQSGKRPGGKEPRKRHRNKRPRVKREGDTSSDDENGQRDDNDATSYTGEMSNYHGEGGDDTGTNQQSSILMGVKREADKSEEEDDNNDIVFIKEELDDSWPPSGSNNTTTNQGAFYHGLPGSSNQDSMYQAQDNSQDPSFGSLSDMNLVPVGSQEGAVMWAQSGSYQGAGRGRGRGRSPGASSSSQDLQPGMDQQGTFVLTPSSKECDVCGKLCSSRSNLKAHKLRHAGQYPYHCAVCGKGCASTGQLRGHMVLHTGKKEFKCVQCGHEYTYKYQLKAHRCSQRNVSE